METAERQFSVTKSALCALGLMCLLGIGMPAVGQTSSVDQLTAACAGLARLQLSDTTIRGAEVVEPDSFVPPGSTRTLSHPRFCRVAGVTMPSIEFEVWLPVGGWNGKFQGVGNGGMAGTISYPAMALALDRGYATASTDTGHRAGPEPFDSSWAMGRPDLIEDFGHRALHLTTVNGKAVTESLYGQPPAYSYYVGCSKGGQQGLMEAQRYPDDYDGLIAGDPAYDWTRFYAGAHLWYSLAMLDEPGSYLPAAKLPTLGNAVNSACDANDGIRDGILQDPRACRFDPRTLTCPGGTDGAACLTPMQVTAVEKIWTGVTDSSGQLVHPPLVPGGEAAPGGWSRWVTGSEPFASLHRLGGEGFFRNFVFEDDDWDFRTFDFDSDLEFALEKVGAALDADDPDLRTFNELGGKLIVYHGWSDPDISPLASIEYFEEVVRAVAPGTEREAALAETQDFFRLFMVPGMAHCSGGPGPDQFDALTALERWVERGIAPDRIIASKVTNGNVVMTRPLCVYPNVAKWDGVGDTDAALSFICEAP